MIFIDGACAVYTYNFICNEYDIFSQVYLDIYGCTGYIDNVCFIYKHDVCLLEKDSISIGSIVQDCTGIGVVAGDCVGGAGVGNVDGDDGDGLVVECYSYFYIYMFVFLYCII